MILESSSPLSINDLLLGCRSNSPLVRSQAMSFQALRATKETVPRSLSGVPSRDFGRAHPSDPVQRLSRPGNSVVLHDQRCRLVQPDRPEGFRPGRDQRLVLNVLVVLSDQDPHAVGNDALGESAGPSLDHAGPCPPDGGRLGNVGLPAVSRLRLQQPQDARDEQRRRSPCAPRLRF